MSAVIENEEVKDIEIDFKPAVINILEEEKFKEYINRVVAEYTGHVPSVENLTVDRKTRASLNKLITKIETRRKEIKNQLMPLTQSLNVGTKKRLLQWKSH